MADAKGVHDIRNLTLRNEHYRQVVATGPTSQLVVMAIEPGSGIDAEVHDDTDQLLLVVDGEAEVILDGEASLVPVGHLAYVPGGVHHEVRNAGEGTLRLYTIYAPPEHPDGTVHATKADADAYEREHHGA